MSKGRTSEDLAADDRNEEGLSVVGTSPQARLAAQIERGDARLVDSMGRIAAPDPTVYLSAWLPAGLSAVDRLALMQHLLAAARNLIAAEVVDARSGGATWEQIGGVLGITRQAAHERFTRTSTS